MSSSNTVKDRSGQGLPPKAERRALGKAAARKRAQQRHRRELLNRIGRVAVPVVVVGIIVGAIWLFGGGDDTPGPAAGSPTSAAPTTPDWSIPADLDPALNTEPVITAGGTTPLTQVGVTILVEGSGPVVQVGDYLRMNFHGAYYATGELFDRGSTWANGVSTPYEAAVGVGGFIPGWDQGLTNGTVTVGSRVRLDIPEALAYAGAQGSPQGDLTFIVDILAVQG